jgi:hypothetical protein
MSKVPGSGSEPDKIQVIVHRGYQVRARAASGEWVTSVAWPGERPTVIVASEREEGVERAKAWIDERLAGENDD